MYSATGTLVRLCRSLSAVSCSGVMYTVVETFLRDTARHHTWHYVQGQSTPRGAGDSGSAIGRLGPRTLPTDRNTLIPCDHVAWREQQTPRPARGHSVLDPR